MADRVQVNFGWLNDYSGAKFAPLTLADKVLMSHSEKNFQDYVDDNLLQKDNEIFKANKDIDKLEYLVKAIHNPLNEDNSTNFPEDPSEIVMLDAYAAGYLLDLTKNGGPGYIVKNSNDGNISKSWILSQYGIEEGMVAIDDAGNQKGLIPIAFKNGRPVKCEFISSINTPLQVSQAGVHLIEELARQTLFDGEGNLKSEHRDKESYLISAHKDRFHWGEFKDGLITGQHGIEPQGLRINIKGNAKSAVEALYAVQSGLSAISLNSDKAKKADRLSYDMQFSKTDENVTPEASHISGVIKFSEVEIPPEGESVPIVEFGLKLTDILKTDGTVNYSPVEGEPTEPPFLATALNTSYGPEVIANYDSATGATAFNIPQFTVDTTGRITSIKNKAIRPTLDIADHSQSTPSSYKQAPIICASGDNTNGWQFMQFGVSADRGVYVDWENDSSIPVLMGAAWNDYAEFRKQEEKIEAGYCVASTDDGKVHKTTEKFQACDGIVSDTFGFSIGKSEEYQTPLAVSGRVLAYCEGNPNNYHAGDTVCAGPEGKVCKMTREEIREWPDRVVGIVSEIPNYNYWNSTIPINGRIWIKVK